MKTLIFSLLWLVGVAARSVHGYIGSTSTTNHGWSKVVPVAFRNNKSVKKGDDIPVAGPKVSGHSVVTIPTSSSSSSSSEQQQQQQNRAVLLFGGLTGPAGSPCTDETWEFTTPSNEWTRLDAASKPRVRMYAASALLDDNKFVMFGGWDPGAPGSGGEFLNDIWEFDLTKNQWNEVGTKLPFPVSRHTACTIQKCGKEEEEMIIVHTYKGILVYKKDGTLIEQPTMTFRQDDTSHNPDGYSMCCVAPLNDSQMLLFGGSTRTQQMSQDAYVLDCINWTWTKLDVSSNKNKEEERPPILASSCAAQVDDNEVLIFGGASIGSTGYEGGMGLIPLNDTWLLKVTDDGKTAYWKKVVVVDKDGGNDDDEKKTQNNPEPEGRVAGSLSCIGPSSFLLQGGYDPLTKTTFEEPWILNL